MFHVDFTESYKNDYNKIPCKVHISEINVLPYLQRVAILKVQIMTILEMMLSLLPKIPITIESRLKKVVHKTEHMHDKNVRECLSMKL